jgi:hypothetical protein
VDPIFALDVLGKSKIRALTGYRTSAVQPVICNLRVHIGTCTTIARQQVGKHIQATKTHSTIGHPLLGN